MGHKIQKNNGQNFPFDEIINLHIQVQSIQNMTNTKKANSYQTVGKQRQTEHLQTAEVKANFTFRRAMIPTVTISHQK